MADWIPDSRRDQLTMARNWLAILRQPGEGARHSTVVTKGDNWNVPREAVNEFGRLTAAAAAALAAACKDKARSPVSTAQCKIAFDTLTAAMRNMKRRWFLVPPLTSVDSIVLRLNPDDSV